MSGGEISGNTAKNYGGGVYITDSGTFTMSGGEISGNSGKNGAAIMIPSGGSVFQMTGGSVIDNIGSGLTCNGASTVTVGGSALFSNNTGGSHLSFDKGGTLYLTGGTFKKGEHGSSALDMKNTNIYLSGPVTFDADLPFDVLSSNGLLTINGDFTGSIKSFNLQDENLDGKDFIKIDSNKTSQKPSELINRFALSNTSKWTLVADDTTNTIKTVLNKPKALSGEGNVTVKWINATIANVSIRLDPNANDATDVFVKLGDKPSQTRTGTFSKGSTISDLQITGLTAGTTYSVTAVLKNSDISEKEFTYEDILTDVQAPTPAAVIITGEGGAEIPSTGILLPQGKSMTFGVLVTDKEGTILKDEPVTWEITGGKTSENERTATTITLTGGNSEGPDTLKATTDHGSVSASATITVTTKQPTQLSIEADKEAIALGDTVHLTAVATDDGGEHFGGYTVQWTGSATATSKTGTAAAFTPTTAGSYSLTATVSDPVLTAQKTI
ncbi:MAG: right-handed parallel beta-helix repeat-containing protein, partial [Methanocorpusculum sp.]|nr:right-handed parallel beta-helix repeat-containing protein [Methanocorpusculum sp.]